MAEAGVSKSFTDRDRATADGCSDGVLPPFGALAYRSTQRRSYRASTWLNLVCLDAPLVALSWQWLLADTFALPVNAASRAALFLTAWLIYLGDRWGDTLALEPGRPTSLRQRFCLRHRKAWLAAIAIAGCADAWLIITFLDSLPVAAGATVGAVALGYLIVNRRRSEIWRVLPLKEGVVGFLFATGVMVGLVRSVSSDLLAAWILLGGLCTMNCISIAVWERGLDLAQQRDSIATAHPVIARVVSPVLLVLASGCFVFAFTDSGSRDVYLCLAASALLLAVVHRFGNRIDPDSRTALADLVLLTPLAALAF